MEGGAVVMIAYFSLKINLGRLRHVGQAASAGFGRQAA